MIAPLKDADPRLLRFDNAQNRQRIIRKLMACGEISGEEAMHQEMDCLRRRHLSRAELCSMFKMLKVKGPSYSEEGKDSWD